MVDDHKPGLRALRRGRFSQKNARYFITMCSYNRIPVLWNEGVPGLIFKLLNDSDGQMDLVASVVMPDHLHCVVKFNDLVLSNAIGRFKGKSARAINRLLGRQGPLWQKAYYDHKFHSDEDLGPILNYLWNNPEIPGTHFRCNRQDWSWFKPLVSKDVPYPAWLNEHGL